MLLGRSFRLLRPEDIDAVEQRFGQELAARRLGIVPDTCASSGFGPNIG
jgi:hypothetical protein